MNQSNASQLENDLAESWQADDQIDDLDDFDYDFDEDLEEEFEDEWGEIEMHWSDA